MRALLPLPLIPSAVVAFSVLALTLAGCGAEDTTDGSDDAALNGQACRFAERSIHSADPRIGARLEYDTPKCGGRGYCILQESTKWTNTDDAKTGYPTTTETRYMTGACADRTALYDQMRASLRKAGVAEKAIATVDFAHAKLRIEAKSAYVYEKGGYTIRAKMGALEIGAVFDVHGKIDGDVAVRVPTTPLLGYRESDAYSPGRPIFLVSPSDEDGALVDRIVARLLAEKIEASRVYTQDGRDASGDRHMYYAIKVPALTEPKAAGVAQEELAKAGGAVGGRTVVYTRGSEVIFREGTSVVVP